VIRQLLLFVMTLLVLASIAATQSITCNSEPAPPYKKATSRGCSTLQNKPVVPGLTHSRMTWNESCVNVLTLDLHANGLRIATVGAVGGPCQTVSQLAPATTAIAAVNGGFFCYVTPSLCTATYPTCPEDCTGFSMLKIGGTLDSTNCSPTIQPIKRTTLGWSLVTNPKIQPVESGKNWDEVVDAIGAGPNLVTDGKVNVTDEGFPWVCEQHPRTAVGLTRGGYMVLLTVDSPGLKLPDLAEFMINQLHVMQAMNFDGGGSTTMIIKGKVVNHPSGNGERPVYDALEIVPTPTAPKSKPERP